MLMIKQEIRGIQKRENFEVTFPMIPKLTMTIKSNSYLVNYVKDYFMNVISFLYELMKLDTHTLIGYLSKAKSSKN